MAALIRRVSRIGYLSISDGAMELIAHGEGNGREGGEINIWQQYTEELYRGEPNATDSFNENIGPT